jgi:hypothetical protein
MCCCAIRPVRTVTLLGSRANNLLITPLLAGLAPNNLLTIAAERTSWILTVNRRGAPTPICTLDR